LQRYCFFITPTIGFEEYFGELKTVKYLLIKLVVEKDKETKRQRDKRVFISMLVGVRVGQNTNYKIYILYNINII